MTNASGTWLGFKMPVRSPEASKRMGNSDLYSAKCFRSAKSVVFGSDTTPNNSIPLGKALCSRLSSTMYEFAIGHVVDKKTNARIRCLSLSDRCVVCHPKTGHQEKIAHYSRTGRKQLDRMHKKPINKRQNASRIRDTTPNIMQQETERIPIGISNGESIPIGIVQVKNFLEQGLKQAERSDCNSFFSAISSQG